MKRRKAWIVAVVCIAAIIVILAAVVAIKTATFTSKQVAVNQKVSYPIDLDGAAGRLSGALKFKTVSDIDTSQVDYSEFAALQDYLGKSFPLVNSTLEKKVINNYGLLYIWKGSDSQKLPVLLLAHQDVVPAPAEGWKHQPFSGDIADGFIWGRGAIDDKGSLMSILEMAEYLVKDGFKPSRTVYIALGFDEEVGGQLGAAKIAEYFKAQDIKFDSIYDEGMFVTQGAVPGVKSPVALIAVAEKGYLSLQLIAESVGGASSMPPDQTTVGILAAAIDKLQNNRFPTRMTGPAADLFDYLGPEMSFTYKMIFANMWLFRPVIEGELTSSPGTNATIRTTAAPTMFEGSQRDNVLPARAVATVNFRILPGDTMQSVTDRVKTVINDPRVVIQPAPVFANDPSPVSSTAAASFKVLTRTVREVMPDVVVAPMISIGGTDCIHYIGLSPNIYRFLPERLYGNDLDMLHGMNERISIANYGEMINYYILLVRNLCT
jgi:carboxypeptidase PM20D1